MGLEDAFDFGQKKRFFYSKKETAVRKRKTDAARGNQGAIPSRQREEVGEDPTE